MEWGGGIFSDNLVFALTNFALEVQKEKTWASCSSVAFTTFMCAHYLLLHFHSAFTHCSVEKNLLQDIFRTSGKPAC